MAECTKTECPANICGFKGMKTIQKFVLSKQFLIFYTIFIVIFITMRLFQIPYGENYLCKLLFALGSLAQFMVIYAILIITISIVRVVLSILKKLFKWVVSFFKKRKSNSLRRRVQNFFIRFGLILLITIVALFLMFLIKIYIIMIYYTFGIVIGYTIIGSNNECISNTSKKK